MCRSPRHLDASLPHVRSTAVCLACRSCPSRRSLPRGGVWFQCGGQQLHVGVDEPFTPAGKAHPALVVTDLDFLAARLGDVTWDDAIPGTRRFYASDPFGNRIEFVAPEDPAD